MVGRAVVLIAVGEAIGSSLAGRLLARIWTGPVFVTVGVATLALVAIVDVKRDQPDPAFGRLQIAGLLVGVILVTLGLVIQFARQIASRR